MDRTGDFHQSLLVLGLDVDQQKSRTKQPGIAAFDRTSRECNAKITRIRKFLNESMKNYVDFEKGISERERDKIDALVSEALGEVETIIRKLDEMGGTENQNAREHQKGVVMLLLDSARGLQQITNSARSLRQRHVLSSRTKLCSNITTEEKSAVVDEVAVREIGALDDQEMMMLEQENQKLEQHLSTVLEEARRIEKNAHEVSTLLSLFSEEVMKQHEVIGTIYDDAQNNVDIVNRVPAELIKAAEHGKSFRHFMLAFLLISGLLLLLLDWMS